jgi:hypothetical protein
MICRGLLSLLLLTLGLIPLAWADPLTASSILERPPGFNESEKRFRVLYEQEETLERLVSARSRLSAVGYQLALIRDAALSDDFHEGQIKSLLLRCDGILPRLDRNEREVAIALLFLSQARIDRKTTRLTEFEKAAITRHEKNVIEPLKRMFETTDRQKNSYLGIREAIKDLHTAMSGDQKMEEKITQIRKASYEASRRLDGLNDQLDRVIEEMRVLGGFEDFDDLIYWLLVIENEMKRQRSIFIVLKYWTPPRHPSIFGDP